MDLLKGVSFAEEKRVIDWALQNIEDWEAICGISKDKLSEAEFDRLAKRLLTEGFFQVYYVLYYRFAIQNGISVFPKP